MEKRGEKNTSFKRRFFLLRDMKLIYFKDSSAQGKVQGSIELASADGVGIQVQKRSLIKIPVVHSLSNPCGSSLSKPLQLAPQGVTYREQLDAEKTLEIEMAGGRVYVLKCEDIRIAAPTFISFCKSARAPAVDP